MFFLLLDVLISKIEHDYSKSNMLFFFVTVRYLNSKRIIFREIIFSKRDDLCYKSVVYTLMQNYSIRFRSNNHPGL